MAPEIGPEPAHGDVDGNASGNWSLTEDAVVLLVEDNIIFALDLEDMLRHLGVASVVACSRVATAIEAIDTREIDFCILDIDLGAETSLPVARRLRSDGIVFVFASDCDDPPILTQEFSDISILAKPYTMENLRLILGL